MLCPRKRRLPDLVIHWEEWDVGQRSVDCLPTRLQKVLKTLVVFIRPRQGKEVRIVDCPVKWSVCRLRLFLSRHRRHTGRYSCCRSLSRY